MQGSLMLHHIKKVEIWETKTETAMKEQYESKAIIITNTANDKLTITLFGDSIGSIITE